MAVAVDPQRHVYASDKTHVRTGSIDELLHLDAEAVILTVLRQTSLHIHRKRYVSQRKANTTMTRLVHAENDKDEDATDGEEEDDCLVDEVQTIR